MDSIAFRPRVFLSAVSFQFRKLLYTVYVMPKKEVNYERSKKPQRPLLYYYGIVLLVMVLFVLFNTLAMPKKQHDKAAQILMENREKLDALSQYLYEHETITGNEFMQILGA